MSQETHENADSWHLHLDGECEPECHWCEADRDRAEESQGG